MVVFFKPRGARKAMATLSALTAKRLQGKVALVTGGAAGIGECTAKLFAQHGAKVAIADVRDGLGQALIKQIGHSNSTYFHCDVTNEDAVDKTVSAFGKLDIMLNNAAITDPPKQRIWDTEKAGFEHVLAVNITGVFLGMKHAARVMVPAGGGSIISTASMASGMGGAGTHAYVGSKHAVVGLTKNLAVELGQFGVRVNCLSPFGVATELAKKYVEVDDEEFEKTMRNIANLKGTTLKARDIADAALFLASDEARYVSGQNLFIDGGFTITNSAMKVFND